jgi:hypothetical protein
VPHVHLHANWLKYPTSRGWREMPHSAKSISGLVVEYIVAIDVTRVRFPADAFPHGAFLYAKTARIANTNAQTGPPILL